MKRLQSTSGRPTFDACPRDAELNRFDQGTLPEDEADRLGEHVAHCDRCAALLAEQPQDDTRLVARILTPGTSLLAERDYQRAQQALLDHPETISVRQLETAETNFALPGRRRSHDAAQIGSYRLRYELGQGAMGIVYRARHVNLKRDAALKILHPHLTADDDVVRRFYREMEAIGQLRDPHIVQAYDAGEFGDVHFLAMEYVDGADAARLCAALGQLPVPEACEIVRQAALGLETARRRGMVHRDIKPSNLMVARNGQVKILDLGLASFRHEGMEPRLDDGAVGTVDYMAPEQWQGSSRIDIRADIYSLGCTLYKLLSGHPPFYRAPDDGVSKMQAHLYQVAPALREIRRDVPRELDALVIRMLAKKPCDRFLAGQEVAEALQPYCEGSDLAALVERCMPPSTGDPVEVPDRKAARRFAASRRSQRRRWTLWAVAATACVALLAFTIIRWKSDGAMVVSVRESRTEPPISATVLAGHKGPLEAVDVSADGKWILSGAHDRTVRLWDAETGQERLQLIGHEDAVLDVAFTPDGRHAVSASKDRTARLWDLATGQELHRFSPHRDAVRCVAVSEDGNRLLTGCIDAHVRMWDLHTGQLLAVLGGHRSWVRGVTFLPGVHEAISCGNDRIIILWDLDTARMRRVMQGHTQAVSSISAAADGLHVVTGSEDTTIRLWNLHTEQQLNVMRLHVAPVRRVQFVPGSNYLASASDDRDVRLWDPFRGESLAEFSGHQGDVTDVAVHLSAGLLVSASADRTARVYKLPPLPSNPSPDKLVNKTPDSPSGESSVSIQPIRRWPAGQKGLQTIAVTPNGERIATGGGDDNVIRVWATGTGELVRELAEPTDGILCIGFSPDGRWLAAASKDQQIYLWDMSADSPAKTLVGHTRWVSSLDFCGTGERLLSGAFDATMRLWDVKNGQTIVTFPGQIEWIRAVALGSMSAGPLAISAGNAGCLRLWETGQGEEGQVLRFRMLEAPYQAGQISSIAVTSDGKLVAAAGWNRPLQVWNTASGERVAQFGDPNLTIYDLAWYGDDNRLWTACADGTLRLWDRRNGRELNRFVGHTDAVRCVSTSTDMQVIVSAGADGAICLWPTEGAIADAQ